jgi:hypothetical protein
MLTLKNPFAKFTSSPSPPGSSTPAVNDPHKAVKRWQLEQGRTKKRVEDLTVQLDAARLALAQSERVLGERMVDELDVTTDTAEMKQAGDRVHVLEAALAVARQKDEAAQADLKRAEHPVANDAKFAALSHLKHVIGPEMDQRCLDLEQFVNEKLVPALDHARLTIGLGIETNFLSAATLGFEHCLLRSCRALIKPANVYTVLLRDKKWSDYIPSPEDVITMRTRNGQR